MHLHRHLSPLLLVALLAAPAAATDMLVYADKDGTIHRVQVVSVSKDDGKDLNSRILVGGRKRKLTIPARMVVSFRRGDPGAKNQWAKGLARGKRLMSSGQLATEGTVPGAEETFAKIAYTTEKGIPGEEENDLGDVLWLPKPFQRNGFQHLVPNIVFQDFRHLGLDKARGHCVAADASGCKLLGRRLRQRDHGSLAGGIGILRHAAPDERHK